MIRLSTHRSSIECSSLSIVRGFTRFDIFHLHVHFQERRTALNESGDPNAPVHNRQACAEVQFAMIQKAQEKNPHNIDLQMEKIKVLETLHGNHSEEVMREWRNVSQQPAMSLRLCFPLKCSSSFSSLIGCID